MKYNRAIKLLKENIKMRRIGWLDIQLYIQKKELDEFESVSKLKLLMYVNKDNIIVTHIYTPDFKDMKSKDWEIVE